MRKLLLAIILTLCCSMNSLASLTFAVNADRVTHNNATLGSISTITILIRVYLTDATARQYLCAQVGAPDWQITWRADLAGDYFEIGRQQGTAFINAQANAANFAAYGTSKWLFIAAVMVPNGAASTNKILIGDATTPAAEPSSYVAQVAGAGTIDTTNADFYVGNGAVTTRELHGSVDFCAVYDRALTTLEIQQQQFWEFPASGCVLFTYPGLFGTGTQPDYSKYAISGTITGTLATFNPATFGRNFR